MKRVFRDALALPGEGGWRVALDGKPLHSPAKRPLLVPTEALALALCEEWLAQGPAVRPERMPLTRLANAAQDLMPERRAAVVDSLSGFAATDLVCYRAAEPADLVRRQQAVWQPQLDWLAELHGIRLVVTRELLPVEQPADALAALRGLVEAVPDWPLVGLYTATTALGSLVLALALRAGRLAPDAALAASLVDELHAIERWGEEAEQQRRHAALRLELEAVARFMVLVGAA